MDRTLALVLALAAVSAAADPDPNERAVKYARAVKAEDDVSRKLAAAVAKPGESERERWYKRLDEVFTGKVPADPADWFDLIALGRSEWPRDGSKFFAELHERVCYRFDLPKETAVTRDTFARYAARFLGADSPRWRVVEFGDESRGVFKHLDADRDGRLTKAECSPGLGERFDTADADKDGAISPTEYKEYLTARVGYEAQFPQPEKGKGDRPPVAKPAVPAEEPAEPRPVVYRNAKDLPKEVPGWFRELDTDKDVQVGLYEWAAAKRPVTQFQAMDLNGDGLLEVAEYLRWRKAAGDAGKGEDVRAAVPAAKGKKK
jgi:hypothetical protein